MPEVSFQLPSACTDQGLAPFEVSERRTFERLVALQCALSHGDGLTLIDNSGVEVETGEGGMTNLGVVTICTRQLHYSVVCKWRNLVRRTEDNIGFVEPMELDSEYGRGVWGICEMNSSDAVIIVARYE